MVVTGGWAGPSYVVQGANLPPVVVFVQTGVRN